MFRTKGFSYDLQKWLAITIILLQYDPSLYIDPSNWLPPPGELVGTAGSLGGAGTPETFGCGGGIETFGGGGGGCMVFGVAFSVSVFGVAFSVWGGEAFWVWGSMAGATGVGWTGWEVVAWATWLDPEPGSSNVYPSIKVGWTSVACGDSGDKASLLGVGPPTPREVSV